MGARHHDFYANDYFQKLNSYLQKYEFNKNKNNINSEEKDSPYKNLKYINMSVYVNDEISFLSSEQNSSIEQSDFMNSSYQSNLSHS